MKEITTEGLIKFLVEKEFINYAEDHEIIDKIIGKLKEHKEPREYKGKKNNDENL